MGDGYGLSEEAVIHIVSAVMRESREADRVPVSNLTSDQEFTESLFSELRYALGTPSLTNGPTRQQLPVEITADGFLVFGRTPPTWATHMTIVRRGQVDETLPLPDCNPPRPIPVGCPDRVVAVKLLAAEEEARLVSFATHTPRKAAPGGARRPKVPAKPVRDVVQASAAQAAPAETKATP